MRTCKSGLDYFSFDVDFFEDPKVEFISAKYDILGENVCIKLLCRIYRNGYFLPWGDDECLLFSKRAGNQVTYELVDGVVKEMCKRGFFSQIHYEKFGVLTSNGIQKRFLDATRRRKDVSMREELIIADIKGYNVSIIPFIDDKVLTEIPEKGYNGTQSKVKESKVKNITPYMSPLGEFKNVKLTQEQFDKLKARYGDHNVCKRIEDLSRYIQSKGKKYKDHYATLLTWFAKDGTGESQSAPTPSYHKRINHD